VAYENQFGAYLVADEIAKPVEDKDTKKFGSESVAPCFVQERVLVGRQID
jgi:hypothetical protein